MLGSRRPAAGPPLPPSMVDPDRRPRGLLGALFSSAAGLTIATAVAVKLLVAVLGPRGNGGLFGAVDTIASVMLAAGGAYFVFRGLSVLRRRLLWRVRRKLIISYLFVGLIPALLIITFFLLGGYLLFVNVSSYMLQTHLRHVTERVRSVAQITALEVQTSGERQLDEVLARRRSMLTGESVAVSLALLPVTTPCGQPAATDGMAEPPAPSHVAGPWPHVNPPAALPAWIGCDGYSGLFVVAHPARAEAAKAQPSVNADLLVRAVALPSSAPGYAVVVDVPFDASAKAKLRADTSLILNGVGVGEDLRVEIGRSTPRNRRTADGTEAGVEAAAAPSSGRFQQAAVSFLEYRDWTTGQIGSVQASMTVSIAQIYGRLTVGRESDTGLSLSQAFMFVLIAVGVLFLLIQAIAIAMGLALAKSITGSVHELFTGTIKVQQGDFTHRIAVRAADQLGALAESFNSMTASIDGLLLEAAEKRRLEEELRIAHEIQMSLLPQAPTAIPGLSIAALCVPAREVGGDYYDFLPLPDDRLAVLIADVAGKGTSAALYMAELKGLMLSLSRSHRSPRELLIVANHLIAEHLDARSFITMTYAIIDLRARTMTYARAGHTPLLYLPGGAPEGPGRMQVLAPDGLVLGLKIDEGTLFDRLLVEQTLPLRTGDVFVLYTDGISEAMNAQDDCYGEHRLARVIEAHAALSCEALRDRTLSDVMAFAGDTPQHDDMTMILLKVGDLPVVTPAVAVVDAASGALSEVSPG